LGCTVGRDAAGSRPEDRPAEAGLPRRSDPGLRADGEKKVAGGCLAERPAKPLQYNRKFLADSQM
jgi:hypothetical protein